MAPRLFSLCPAAPEGWPERGFLLPQLPAQPHQEGSGSWARLAEEGMHRQVTSGTGQSRVHVLAAANIAGVVQGIHCLHRASRVMAAADTGSLLR